MDAALITGNHQIREVRQDGTVATWAGTGAFGLVDDPGSTARLNHPFQRALAARVRWEGGPTHIG